jgi:hypothetical protein
MNITDFIHDVDALIIKNNWARKGEAVVFVYGEPIRASGVTNCIYIHYL